MTGRIIDNPVMDERIEFIKTTEETRGEMLLFYQTLYRKNSGFIKEHVHLNIDETFEVAEGTAFYSMNGIHNRAAKGETVLIPKGVKHQNPYNIYDEKLVLKRTQRPDAGIENFYRKLYQLAGEGKLNKNGEPGLIQISVIAKNNLTQTYFTFLPVAVQKTLFYVLGNLGELLGYSHMPH